MSGNQCDRPRCAADDAHSHHNRSIYNTIFIQIPWLIALGAIHDPELIPRHIRLDPELHLGIAGRILHFLITQSAEISNFLFQLINMKNILLFSLGMGQDDTIPAIRRLKTSSGNRNLILILIFN